MRFTIRKSENHPQMDADERREVKRDWELGEVDLLLTTLITDVHFRAFGVLLRVA